jgi:hypothetical protein
MPPRWRGQGVDEGERQLGQRAHIEIDHGELRVAIEPCRLADEPEAGIVDHIRRLEIAGVELGGKKGSGARPLEIDDQHIGPRPAGRRDFVGKLHQPVLAPRHQSELMPVLGEDARKLRTDARRGAGDQRNRSHSPPSASACSPMRRRSSMRSRGDTPSRSAARHNRLSSSSSRRPSA